MIVKARMWTIAHASLTAIAVGSFASPANALVVLASTNTVLPAQITIAANLLDPTSTTGTVILNTSGNDLDAVEPNRRSPYDTTAFVGSALYHSVSKDSTATYDFGSNVRSGFSIMWGSPDDYNTLKFFLNGLEVGSFTGADVDDPPPSGTLFVNAVFAGLFDTVVFGSTGQDAFEFTNVSAVPLPAAAWLLLTGLGGLGVLGRRRKAA